MPDVDADLRRRLERLERQVARERTARQEAERLLESKSLELYEANLRLVTLNADLENRVRIRTEELERERRAAQIANERVNLATASGRIGIWNLDISAGTRVWDRLMYELYGRSPDDPTDVDELWRQSLHPEDSARAVQALSDAIHRGYPYDIEFRIVWPNASVRHIRGTGLVSRDEAGRALHMVGANWDVTEARQLAADLRHQMALQAQAAEREIVVRAERDAAEQAARAKSEFLATMSHEIRSPMSGLLGVLELLRASGLDAEQKRMADMVHNSATMLLAVLNDVLDFSKIEAGALSVDLQPTELHRMFDDLVQPHVVSAAHKGLALTLAIDPAVPAWLLTDQLRVQQIVGNLLSNARKFTAAGEIAVSVGVLDEPSAPRLRIAVRDSGIGMSAAVVARLFNPFTQADSSTTRTYGGTGLGLAISKKLAELLDGGLSVTSEVGVGSTFTLDLPLLPCAPAGAPPAEDPAATPARAHAGKRVLVVDDDSTIRWLSQRQLESLGFTVDVAQDGEEGLRQFLAGPHDLVLTDCHMPRMDGVALTKAIRARTNAGARPLPIIGLTADVTEAQRDRCLAAGMSDLAIKPLTVARLSALIAHHLAGAAAAAPTAPDELRMVAFDAGIHAALFDPGDPAGGAWLKEYLATARGDIEVLSALVAAAPERLADLVKLAHSMAGAAFSVGAILAGAAARALEVAAQQQEMAALPRLMASVAAEFAAAEQAMAVFIVGNAPQRWATPPDREERDMATLVNSPAA